MNIEISNEKVTKAIESEMIKVTNSTWQERSHLEKAVEKALREIAKEKVMELLKTDEKYAAALHKLIEVNIVAAFNLVAVRISKDLGDAIADSLAREFRHDRDD